MQMTQEYFDEVMAVASKNVLREERELFGNRRQLPLDESAIVFNFRITYEEKLARLSSLRQAKAAKRAARKAGLTSPATVPVAFARLLTDADTIHARALGISLT